DLHGFSSAFARRFAPCALARKKFFCRRKRNNGASPRIAGNFSSGKISRCARKKFELRRPAPIGNCPCAGRKTQITFTRRTRRRNESERKNRIDEIDPVRQR